MKPQAWMPLAALCASTVLFAPAAQAQSRAALVELMGRYIRGLLDPTITLLEVHKLMYFMQEIGRAHV